MCVETLQIDIDQREEKLMEFHWPMANCTVLHNQINVLSLSFFLRLHLWGTFNAETCSGWNREGGGAPENVDRCMRKCSEAPQDCWLHRLICEIEGWQAKVSAAVVYSSSDFRGNVRNREILWCGRYCTDAAYASPALRDILYSCSGCAAFMFCDQGQRLKISD